MIALRKVQAGLYVSDDGQWAVAADGYEAIRSVAAEAGTGYEGFQGGEWAVVYDARGRLGDDPGLGDNLDWFSTKREAVAAVQREAARRGL